MSCLSSTKVKFISGGMILLLFSWCCLANVDLQPWLDDFYLTLPDQEEAAWEEPAGNDELITESDTVIAAPAVMQLSPQPLQLLRPGLDCWGLALWSWAVAGAIAGLGLAMALARLLIHGWQATGSVHRRKQRRVCREIKALLDRSTNLEQTLPYLATWCGLPENCNGTEIAVALQDEDPKIAAAVTRWEQMRFSPARTDPEKLGRANSDWQKCLREWLLRHKRRHGWRARNLLILMPGTQMQAPVEQALLWNRLVHLQQTVGVTTMSFWPRWFAAEIALVTLAASLVVTMMVWLYFGKSKFRRWLTMLAILLAVTASVRLLVTHRRQQRQLQTAAIVQRQTLLRPAPESNLKFAGAVAVGDLVFIKATKGDWLQVQSQQSLGWLQKDAVTRKKPWIQD